MGRSGHEPIVLVVQVDRFRGEGQELRVLEDVS